MRPHTIDNPFTLELAASVEYTTPAVLHERLELARKAVTTLRAMSIADRVALVLRACENMESRAGDIAQDITRQMGKPLVQAWGEVAGMATRLRYMASIAADALGDTVVLGKEGHERRIVKVPLGVVMDLPAWNYPLLTAVNVIAPAVLAGNAVLVKHSPRTPLCGEHFARAFAEAGAPEGAVQAIFLDHAATETLIGDPRIDHVQFTGSTLGGHKIQAAAKDRFLHVGLELGGNDPAYVAEDCDFESTVQAIVTGAMSNAGQSCCAVERVYVHQSLYARFVEAAVHRVRGYVLGDPENLETSLGPIAQPWHPAALDALVRDAVRRGATCVVGGARTTVQGKGRFFEPTVLQNVGPDATLMNEESFGPLLPIDRVESDEQALALMLRSRLGLTASIWTRDRERAEHLGRQLDFGTIYMNRCDNVDPALPWSGTKDSGRGVTLSRLGFDALTRPKALNYRFTAT